MIRLTTVRRNFTVKDIMILSIYKIIMCKIYKYFLNDILVFKSKLKHHLVIYFKIMDNELSDTDTQK